MVNGVQYYVKILTIDPKKKYYVKIHFCSFFPYGRIGVKMTSSKATLSRRYAKYSRGKRYIVKEDVRIQHSYCTYKMLHTFA